jgi:hypothetical protein
MPPEIVDRITAINLRLNQQFNAPQPPPTDPPPPAQNEPTARDLLTALESLRGEMGILAQHLQSLSRHVATLSNRTFRASFDLQSVDPSFSSPGTPGEGREGVSPR